MRIGMMADVYKPHVSGVTNYISANKQALEASGHEVYVFTFGDQDYLDDEPRVIRSRGFPLIDTGYYFSFHYSPEAKSLLQSMDIVHVHHPFLSGRLALRYCKDIRIPILFTNHTRYDLYIQTYLPILPEGLGETFLQAYLPSFCREIDRVVSPSAGMEKILRRLGVDVPIEVIPNGVDLRRFCSDIHPQPRSNLGFSDEDTVIAYSGRLAPEKNLTFLIRSFAGISRTYPFVKLLLIGDGPDRDSLERLTHELGVAESVHFTGMVPYDQVPGYLAASSFFATASYTEVHPLSVIEAMAAGLPILGIDSPGVGDTVEDGVTGLLAMNDLAEFTAKMSRIVADGDLRLKMGTAARDASRRYAIERTSNAMIGQYQLLVEAARARKHGVHYYVNSFMKKWRQ